MIKRQALLGALSCALVSATVSAAEPLMDEDTYAQYSYEYQCVLQKLSDDLERKEAALTTLDTRFGLSEDNFDQFDETVSMYEANDALTERVRQLVADRCK